MKKLFGKFQSPMGIVSSAKSIVTTSTPKTCAFQSPMGIVSSAKPISHSAHAGFR